jgi:hypothetical protein
MRYFFGAKPRANFFLAEKQTSFCKTRDFSGMLMQFSKVSQF